MMLDLIIENIKANIAQYTELFDLTTVAENCTTQNNTLTIAGLADGRYVLSGAVDGVASKGCFNTIHDFVGGVATTKCFFGDAPNVIACKVHTLNVGEAITRDFAIEKMVDTKTPNAIIAYWSNTVNQQTQYNDNISQDATTKLKITFGVMFRVLASNMITLGGCDVLDKVFIQSVVETKTENKDATVVKFDNIKDRFYAGEYLVIDIGFSYIENMQLNDTILSRAKHFDATLDTVEANKPNEG